MRRTSPRITIADVARHAGVSTATAGRALGGYGYVAQAVRDRIEASAAALGYRPNLLAKGLITGHTRTLGVIAGDLQSPFYARVLKGIEAVARAAGFGVIVAGSDEVVEREGEALRLLLDKQVDGLIVAPADRAGSVQLAEAPASFCPLVQIDRRASGFLSDSVVVDNCRAARDSVALLIAAGHRDIAILAELEHSGAGTLEEFCAGVAAGRIDALQLFPSWQRLMGWLEAHRAAGLPIDPRRIGRVGAYSAAAAERVAQQLLGGADRPTALFTADGLMSASAMSAIGTLDLRIGVDLSLVAFDDLDWMAFIRPGITAVVQPLTEMGETAARLVLARIGGEQGPAQAVMLTPRIALRQSIAPPRR